MYELPMYYCTEEKKMVPGPPRNIRPVYDHEKKEMIRGEAAEEIVNTILRPKVNPNESFELHPDLWRYSRRITYDRICRNCGGLLQLSAPTVKED
jgi:hypothetical protein